MLSLIPELFLLIVTFRPVRAQVTPGTFQGIFAVFVGNGPGSSSCKRIVIEGTVTATITACDSMGLSANRI
jgi:hypothetical protein